MELTRKYIIKVYDDLKIIHTEEVEETAAGIKKVVESMNKMVGAEYKIVYQEVKREI